MSSSGSCNFFAAGNNMETSPGLLLLFKSHRDDAAFRFRVVDILELPDVAADGIKLLVHVHRLRLIHNPQLL